MTIGACVLCGHKCDLAINSVCSKECACAKDIINNFSDQLVNHPCSDDKRIYFFDFTFGDLADLYTVSILRRLHKTDLEAQRACDRQMDKLERSLVSKLNRYCPVPEVRKVIGKALFSLLAANAVLWEWCEKWMVPSKGITDKDMDAMRNAKAQRDAARTQLDLMIDGYSLNAPKNYSK